MWTSTHWFDSRLSSADLCIIFSKLYVPLVHKMEMGEKNQAMLKLWFCYTVQWNQTLAVFDLVVLLLKNNKYGWVGLLNMHMIRQFVPNINTYICTKLKYTPRAGSGQFFSSLGRVGPLKTQDPLAKFWARPSPNVKKVTLCIDYIL